MFFHIRVDFDLIRVLVHVYKMKNFRFFFRFCFSVNIQIGNFPGFIIGIPAGRFFCL